MLLKFNASAGEKKLRQIIFVLSQLNLTVEDCDIVNGEILFVFNPRETDTDSVMEHILQVGIGIKYFYRVA